jgi:putative spermidine/putrescine transport system permease protein
VIYKLLFALFLVFSPFGLFLLAFTILFEGISFSDFSQTFSSNYYFSLLITFTSTFISLFIGSGIAFELIYSKSESKWNKFTQKIFEIVTLFPHIAFAFITYLFFAPEGFIARISGLEINLVNDPYGLGIILNYILKEVPFVALLLLSTKGLDMKRYIKISSALGASKFETYINIYLPMNLKTLITAAIVLFAFILGNYEIPSILGSNTPQFTTVESLELFQSIDESDNKQSRVLIIMIFFTALLFSIVIKSLFYKRTKVLNE